MSALGIVVSPGYMPSAAELAELRPAWIRSISYDLDDIDRLLDVVPPGTRVCIVLNNEHTSVRPDWSGWTSTIADLAQRYAGQIHAAECGNELDLFWARNPADVPPAFGARLAREANAILAPAGIYTLLSSVAGPQWQAWLEQAIALCRDSVNGVAFHPYGEAPDSPTWAGWGFGSMRAAILRAYEIARLPVWCTEWGVKIGDAGGEARQADYVTDGAATIRALGESIVPMACYFAHSDGVGAPSERGASAFGLTSEDGRRRPAWDAFAALATVDDGTASPEPDPVLPEPEPVPMHTPDEESPVPNPWEHFALQQIVSASGCPADAIADAWPRIVAQLVLCGINDRATQVAAIGTVAIESASQFAPVREAFWLDEDWRRANLRYYPWYGRGEIQLTWRENYAAFGRKVDELWSAGGAVDLIARPDDALDPDISAAVLAVYFRDHGGDGLCLIPQAARRGDWREVRRLVQGADAGLDRLEAIAAALDAVPAPAQPFPLPSPVNEGAMLQATVDRLVVTVADIADRIGDLLAAPTLTKKKRLALVEQMRAEREEAIGPRRVA